MDFLFVYTMTELVVPCELSHKSLNIFRNLDKNNKMCAFNRVFIRFNPSAGIHSKQLEMLIQATLCSLSEKRKATSALMLHFHSSIICGNR